MEPKKICKRMDAIRLFCYFSRNNPVFRTRFYHEFIAWVGYGNWKKVDHEIRLAWESARNSFDKLHGLVRSLKSVNDPSDICTVNYNDDLIVDKDLKVGVKNAADCFGELSKRLEAIPEKYTAEGVACMKQLIEFYTKDVGSDSKKHLCDYLDAIKVRELEIRAAADRKKDTEKDK